MFSFPDPKTTDPIQHRVQRILETIPGFLTWVTLIGMFVLSVILPVWMAVFIIMFDIYWIFRTIFITYYSIVAYKRLAEGKRTDWWERCQNIENPKEYLENISEKIKLYQESLSEISFFSFSKRWKVKKEIKKISSLA